jgi:transposase
MEIITGVERRRRWRVEDKLRIVAETEQPGACFVEVARRHEVCRSLLWNWRRQVQRGTLRANAAVNDDKIEITLTDGTMVRAGHDISLVTLRRVMAALRG